MGYIIIAIFIVVVILSYIEDYLGKYKLPLYLLIGFTLILLAGLREVGIDPDSQNYEISFCGITIVVLRNGLNIHIHSYLCY